MSNIPSCRAPEQVRASSPISATLTKRASNGTAESGEIIPVWQAKIIPERRAASNRIPGDHRGFARLLQEPGLQCALQRTGLSTSRALSAAGATRLLKIAALVAGQRAPYKRSRACGLSSPTEFALAYSRLNAAIELKAEHRLDRNYLGGRFGEHANSAVAAAATTPLSRYLG